MTATRTLPRFSPKKDHQIRSTAPVYSKLEANLMLQRFGTTDPGGKCQQH